MSMIVHRLQAQFIKSHTNLLLPSSCLEDPKDQERGLRPKTSAKNDLISDSLWTAIQEEINGMCLVIEIWDS